MRAVLGSLVLVVLFVLVDGCILPVTNQSDGPDCSKDDECKSHRCIQGFCGGSSCKPSDSDSCDTGWKCVHSKPDAITGFFGSDGSDTCVATCGHCPGNSYCKKDSPPDAVCVSGKAPLELTVVAPEAIVGQPTKITAVAEQPSGPIVECTWELGDGATRDEKTVGPVITRSFKDAGEPYVRVSCVDDGGRRGFVEGKVKVACAPSGSACTPLHCCADPTMRCVGSGGGGNTCRVPTPAVVDVTGPTAIPVGTEAQWTAAITSGDGAISHVSWSFTDSLSTDSGTTVTHKFSKAGVKNVTANVTTTIGTNASTDYSVTVCQTANGRCEVNEPCCAPLTCDGAGIKTCK